MPGSKSEKKKNNGRIVIRRFWLLLSSYIKGIGGGCPGYACLSSTSLLEKLLNKQEGKEEK